MPPRHNSQIVVWLIFFGVIAGLALGIITGAILLRAAVAAFNKLFARSVDSPITVPVPTYFHAASIVIFTGIINITIAWLLGYVTLDGAIKAADSPQLPTPQFLWISLLIAFSTSTLMLKLFLPAKLISAIGVSLLNWIIVLVIATPIFLLVNTVATYFRVGL